MSDPHPIDLDIEGLEDPVEIGVGGFATVYKTYQPAFRRTVAVKVLATLNLDDAARERFERECQAMGSLSEHPNIVTVYGAGFTNSGRPYLVMAFLPGGSLQERLDQSGPIPWQDATLYGVHLAGALETAHRGQVVHRDIKPANVLMSTFGDAQLTDFGIARISGGHETRSGVITASMAHAPPEILDGQRPTVAADVYSLGSTIFELIYGKPAFEHEGDESMVPMLRRILSDPPPDLRTRGVPDEICKVLEKSMAKDLTQRQPSAVAFGRELQAARRALGLEAGKLTVPSDVAIDLDEGADISFVAAPSQMLCSNCHSEIPIGVDTCPQCGTVVGAALPMSPAAVTAQASGTDISAAVAGLTPGVAYNPATGQYVAVPVEKKRSKGLLVGVLLLIVLLLGAGGFAVYKATSKVDTAAPSGPGTTEAGAPDTTTTAEPTTFDATVEENFLQACEKNQQMSRATCRCIFKGMKEQLTFARFRELNQLARDHKSLKGTELETIIQSCSGPAPAGGTSGVGSSTGQS